MQRVWIGIVVTLIRENTFYVMQVIWGIFYSCVHFPICNTTDLNTFYSFELGFLG